MRPRMGAVTLVLGLSLLTLGCDQIQQQLSGARDARPVLTSLRDSLAGKRTQLSQAVMQGEMDDVPSSLNGLKSTLDSLETQAGKMSMMDGQEMKLKVASARNIIKDAEPFVMQNDTEGVRAQQRNLDQVLFEIDAVLERAISMTDAAPSGGS
jgi:paraquat-inducible protein B